MASHDAASLPLGLSLEEHAGRRFLSATRGHTGDALSLDRLRLEITSHARLTNLQRARTQLRELQAHLHESGINARLAVAAAELPDVHNIELRLTEGSATLGLHHGAHLITCRAHLEAAAIHQPQRLFFYDFRSYTPPRTPPRRVVFEVLDALLQRAPFDQLGLDVAEPSLDYSPALERDAIALHLPKLLFLHLFAPEGWKVPSLPAGLDSSLRFTRGAVQLSCTDPRLHPTPRPTAPLLEHHAPGAERVAARQLAAAQASRLFATVDRALFEGRLDDAINLIEIEEQGLGAHPDLLERLGHALLCRRERHHLERLEELCQRSSEDPELRPLAQLLLHHAARLRGDERAAADALRHHLHELDPNLQLLERTYTLTTLGRLEARDNPARAITWLREATRRSPNDAVAITLLEQIYAEQDQHRLRVMPLRRLIQRTPPSQAHRDLQLRLAQVLLRHADDPRGAADIFRELLERQPHHAEATHGLADAERALGRPLEAIRLLERAARYAERHDPEQAPALFYACAEIWLDTGDIPNARLSCQSALGITPDYAPAMRLLARTYQEQGQLQGAIRCLEPMIHLLERRLPRDPEARDELIASYRQLAELYARAEQDIHAVDTFRRLLTIAPDDHDAFAAFERFCLDAGMPEELIGIYQLRLESADDDDARYDALIHLAELYETTLRLPDEAADFIRAALQIRPDEPMLRQRLDALVGEQDPTPEPDPPRAAPPTPQPAPPPTHAPDTFGWRRETSEPPPDAPHLSFGRGEGVEPGAPEASEPDAPFQLPSATHAPDWRDAARQWVGASPPEASAPPATPRTPPATPRTPPAALTTPPAPPPLKPRASDVVSLDAFSTREHGEEPDALSGDFDAIDDLSESADDLPNFVELDDAPNFVELTPAPHPAPGHHQSGDGDAMLRQWPFDQRTGARIPRGGLEARRRELESTRRSGDNEALRALLKEIIDEEISLESRARLRQELAFLAYYELEDLEEARTQIDLACEEDPEGVALEAETLTALEGIAEDSGDHLRLLDVYQRKLNQADDKMRPVYHLLMAQICWERLGRPGEAKRHLSAVLDSEADNESALRTLADIEVHLGFYEAAVERLEHLIELFPEGSFDSLETLSRLGHLYMRELDRFDLARACFERILVVTPNNLDAVHDYCTAARKEGALSPLLDGLLMQLSLLLDRDIQTRDALLDTLTRDDIPEHLVTDVTGILWESADILSRAQQYERAFLAYGLIVALSPDDAVALEQRIFLGRKLQRWHDLAHDLERWAAMLLNPDERFEAYAEAGFLFRERVGDMDRAERALSAAIAPFTDSDRPRPPLYERVVNILEETRSTPPPRTFQRDGTLTANEHHVHFEEDPEADAPMESGEFLGLSSHRNPRLDTIHALLEGDPPPLERSELLTEKAAILSRRPETQRRAINTLRAALSLDPGNATARLALVDGLIASGEYDHALSHLLTLTQRSQDAPETLDGISDRLEIIEQSSEHASTRARTRALLNRLDTLRR